jgi:serine phosphatase RsbU (regulator of sigma subunit)
MTKNLKLISGALFFALMFANIGANFYSLWAERSAYSQRGWEAAEVAGKPTIHTVDADGPAAILRVGDEVVSLQVEPQGACPLDMRVCTAPPGTAYKLAIRRGGQTLEFDLQTTTDSLVSWFYVFALHLVSLIFMIAGLAVFMLKPDDKQALLLALMLGAFAGLFIGGTLLLAKWAQVVVQLARLCGFTTFFPVFLHFFLLFPERGAWARRFPRLEFWLYLPLLSLILPLNALQILGAGKLLAKIPGIELIGRLPILLAIVYLISGLAALAVNYRAADSNNRRRTRVVAAACGLGIAHIVFILGAGIFGLDQAYPSVFNIIGYFLPVTLPLIPVSFAYAIIRHQVIPVSLIIRRSARYVLVSRGAILLDMIAVGISVTAVLNYIFSRVRPPMIVIGLVSAAVGVGAWKIASGLHDRYLRPLIDRRFFRQSYDARQIIAELTGALRGVTDLPRLLELVATKLRTALQTEYVTIYLRDPVTGNFDNAYSCDYSGENNAAGARLHGGQLTRYAMMVDHLDRLEKSLDEAESREHDRREDEFELDAFLSGYDGDGAPDERREALWETKATLLMPLFSKDGMSGVISLGPRLGDLPFSREDKQLLMSVSGPTALAIENARLIERMVEEARRRQELEAENDQRAKELEEARQLQLSMLPKNMPQSPHLEIAAYMKTATEVGGDYYDFHQSDNGVLTVVVGDATGHGLKAGTVVTAMKSLFRTLACEDDLPMIFNQSSRVLKEMNLRSLFMGLTMIKLNDSRLRIAAAGMPPALIYRAKKGLVEEALIKAPPLGGVSGYQYREREYALEHGDVLVLMSDGFPERFNHDREMFDYSRARQSLAEVASRPPREIIEHLVVAGDRWANGTPQNDDITFVVLKMN